MKNDNLNKFKDYCIDNTLISIALTFLVISIDIIFCVISPRSFFYLGGGLAAQRLFILTIDGVVCFLFIFLFLFSRIILGHTGTFLIFFALSVAYLLNWATFLVVGDFLGVDSFNFVFQNFQQLVWIVGQISKWYWVYLISLLLTPILGYMVFLYLKNYFSQFNTYFTKIRMNLFWFSVAGLILLILVIGSHKKKFSYFNIALKFRSSPQLTCLLNWKRALPVTVPTEQGTQHLKVYYENRNDTQQFPSIQSNNTSPVPIILIVIESMRNDLLNNADVMPNLYKLKNESLAITAFAPSNITHFSWPSIFTSQYPMHSRYHYYHPAQPIYPRVPVYDILKQSGYHTAIFSTQNERWCGMNNVLQTSALDVFFSSETSKEENYISTLDVGFAAFAKNFKTAGKLDDGLVADEALRWASTLKDPKFFVAINFQRSHFPYTWPPSFNPPFPSGKPERWFYPQIKMPSMRSRYFNALRYIDGQIGKIIQFLKEKGLYEKSLIIVTGDHGEEFHEHGGTCHGGFLFNESATTLVVIKNSTDLPELKIRKTPELIDIAPTILKKLNLLPPPSFQGQSLDEPAPAHPVFITVNSSIADQDAIVLDGWKLIEDRRNNQQLLYNLNADPAEKMNLSSTNLQQKNNLKCLLLTWRAEQLKYYGDKNLQKKYYPPKFSIE